MTELEKRYYILHGRELTLTNMEKAMKKLIADVQEEMAKILAEAKENGESWV